MGGGRTSTGGRGATPAILALQRSEIEFVAHDFGHEPGSGDYANAAAQALGVSSARVFKTLVLLAHGGDARPRPVVAIVPASGQLSLRALASALGAKRAKMCPPHDAERITGYVVGGVSPFGQKKQLATVIDRSCHDWPTIYVSGGRRGLDLELAAADLVRVLAATVAPIGTG